jgi:hypothetical protein
MRVPKTHADLRRDLYSRVRSTLMSKLARELDMSDVGLAKACRRHPGALASLWIPMDPQLWKIEDFRDFLDARKLLPAAE